MVSNSSTNVFLFKSTEDARSFAKGDVIFAEGDAGAEMFAVQEGQVELVVAGRTVETVEPGGIFGEMALIEKGPRTAKAVAKTECVVVCIDEKRFEFLTQNTPNFALNVLKVISHRLRAMNKL